MDGVGTGSNLNDARANCPPHPLVQLVRLHVRIGVCLLVLFIVAGHAGKVHPMLDLFSHFQVLYLTMGLCGAFAMLVLRSGRFAVVAALASLSPLLLIAPWYVPPPAPNVNGRPSLRVMLFNILQSNTSYDAVVEEITRHDPDIVVFQEIHQPWHNGLRALAASLPHEFYQPAGIVRGNLIMSRFSLIDAVGEQGACFSPGAIATVDVNGQRVSLLVAHTWPPSNIELSKARNDELTRVAQRATEMSAPLILLGDLNITMWSPHYRRFERESGLVNARRGFGVIATFPMNQYALLRVPIDHCLVTPDITVVQCRSGNPCGSDHAPIIVDLALPRISNGERSLMATSIRSSLPARADRAAPRQCSGAGT